MVDTTAPLPPSVAGHRVTMAGLRPGNVTDTVTDGAVRPFASAPGGDDPPVAGRQACMRPGPGLSAAGSASWRSGSRSSPHRHGGRSGGSALWHGRGPPGGRVHPPDLADGRGGPAGAGSRGGPGTPPRAQHVMDKAAEARGVHRPAAPIGVGVGRLVGLGDASARAAVAGWPCRSLARRFSSPSANPGRKPAGIACANESL
jgi:hypothetical protein